MEMVETKLGRLVPSHEVQTVLEDAVLQLLLDFRLSAQNPNNVPMKLSDIARAVSADESQVLAALDALRERQPPLVEEGKTLPPAHGFTSDPKQPQRTFSITGTGVGFVRNMAPYAVGVR